MKKVFIIHGFEGMPNGGWNPWLEGKLAEKGIYACSLPMPEPNNPNVDEWVKTISMAVGNPDEDIFLVGHSLGVPAILRYLETLSLDTKIGGAFLASGPLRIIPKENFEPVNNFLKPSFNFPYIRDVCNKFIVLHGDNDSVVPFKDAEDLSFDLNCGLISVPEGKHLSGDEGFFEFPLLLKAIEKII